MLSTITIGAHEMILLGYEGQKKSHRRSGLALSQIKGLKVLKMHHKDLKDKLNFGITFSSEVNERSGKASVA